MCRGFDSLPDHQERLFHLGKGVFSFVYPLCTCRIHLASPNSPLKHTVLRQSDRSLGRRQVEVSLSIRQLDVHPAAGDVGKKAAENPPRRSMRNSGQLLHQRLSGFSQVERDTRLRHSPVRMPSHVSSSVASQESALVRRVIWAMYGSGGRNRLRGLPSEPATVTGKCRPWTQVRNLSDCASNGLENERWERRVDCPGA
jgi:hypothetical protein